MFIKLLQDPSLIDQVFMVDAFDECMTGRERLLDLVVKNSTNSRGKWIVSSRNWTEIEVQFSTISQKVRLSLEINEESVSEAVCFYIIFKTARLKECKGLDDETELKIREYLTNNARGTFLWVALVCKELSKVAVRKRHLLKKMVEFPSQLGPFYERMMNQIRESEDSSICERILKLAAIVYRPISLAELASLLEISDNLNDEVLEELVTACGSFLTVKEGVIRFVHQSAKDFLLKDEKLDSELGSQHHAVLCRSLDILSMTLRRNMYNLRHSGTLIKDHTPSQGKDVLRHARYFCVFWVDHLKAAIDLEREKYKSSLHDEGIVHHFLKEKALNWLEALSLMERMSDATRTVRILKKLIKDDGGIMCNFVKDFYRFVFSYKAVIELAPLQVYNSALFFSPASSIVRQMYQKTEGLKWVTINSEIPLDWGGCLQFFEGDNEGGDTLAFSPNGAHLASWSWHEGGKIWDLETSACLHTFARDDDSVIPQIVAYSPDGKHLAVGSWKKVQLWDLTTLACPYTFETDSSCRVTSLVFSLDCKRLAARCDSLREDKTFRYHIQSWDLGTGTKLETHDFDTDICHNTAFAPDGTHLALVEARDAERNDTNIRIRNLTTNKHPPALDLGCTEWGCSAAFSADAAWLALEIPDDKTIGIFDCLTSACLQKIDTLLPHIHFLQFSKDGTKLLSAGNGYVKVWDPVTGACLKQLRVGISTYRWSHSTASSPDCMLLAETWKGREIKIWDMAIDTSLQTTRGDDGDDNSGNSGITNIIFSADGIQLATRTSSLIAAVKIWDPTTGTCIKQIGTNIPKADIIFSPDGKRLLWGGRGVIEIWDVSSGVRLQKINTGRGVFTSPMAISSDGNLVAFTTSQDCDIMIWDLAANTNSQDLSPSKELSEKLHFPKLRAVAFSPDDKQLGAVIYPGTILVYDINTGTCLQKLDNFCKLPIYNRLGPQRALEEFDLKSLMHGPLAKRDQDPPDHRLKLSTFSFSRGETWIFRGQKRVLWLPPEYRPTAAAVYDDLVVIGCTSGELLFLHFDIGELDKELAGNAVTMA